MSITIKELVGVIKDANPDMTKKAAEDTLSKVFQTVTTALQEGEEVTIRDFGRFYTKQKPARAGRNPKTGEAIQIAAKTVIRFAPRGATKGI